MFAGSSVSLQFIEIISDTWQNIVCAVKLAKSFIALNSFKSVQYNTSWKCAVLCHVFVTVGLWLSNDNMHRKSMWLYLR